MDYIYATLLGINTKVYDDLVDNSITDNPTILESLKGIEWILLTLLSYNDFNFTFVNFLANLLNFLANNEAWNEPYEKSVLILYPIFLIISFHTIKSINIFSIGYILCFISVMFLEPFIISEKNGYEKLISRSVLSLLLFIGIIISPYFDISPSILKFSYNALGYGLTSVLFQMYFIMTRPIV
jgi:hypothetical protein